MKKIALCKKNFKKSPSLFVQLIETINKEDKMIIKFLYKKKGRLRDQTPGYTHHIYSRIINNKRFMKSKKMKYLMEHVIRITLKKYNFELNNYTLIDNHFHFVIKTIAGEAKISTIMQFIKSQFAQRYNKSENRMGPVWNERYGDRIIEHAEDPVFYFNWLCHYIFFNAVRKNYVLDPGEYEFSCRGFFLEKNYKPRIKLTVSEYFLRLGKNAEERIKKFLEIEKLYIKHLNKKTEEMLLV